MSFTANKLHVHKCNILDCVAVKLGQCTSKLNHGQEWDKWVYSKLTDPDSGLADTYSTVVNGRVAYTVVHLWLHPWSYQSTRYTTADIVLKSATVE